MVRRLIIKPIKDQGNDVMKKLWPYDYSNQDTWPWLTCNVAGEEIAYISSWIKNPKFKYGHLIKGY